MNKHKSNAMANSNIWDFREEREKILSEKFENEGYVIEKGHEQSLNKLKQSIEKAFEKYLNEKGRTKTALTKTHLEVNARETNEVRLYIMNEIAKEKDFLKNYYYAAKDTIHMLCGNELVIQKRPGVSINLPGNEEDILPIHADTWNGVSPFELNIWIPVVDCTRSMCLYILKKDKYNERIRDSKGLLKLSSDDLFKELEKDLTWITIKYGEILAFDQSLPHGFSLNKEDLTHWSFNCRFKGLHTPYWDKRLGEYFMPITVKCNTRIGIGYQHPENWI